MSKFVVLIPWSNPTDPYRRAALDHVVKFWAGHHIEAITFTGGSVGEWTHGRPWSKGAAVIEGTRWLADAEYIAVSDADVIPQWAYVDSIGKALAAGARWGVPHAKVRRLSIGGSEAVLQGELDPFSHHVGLDYEHRGMVGGGFVMLRKEALVQCPIDPRFEAWGNEDESWAIALTALFGRPTRGSGMLAHLWHPRAPRLSPFVGTPESKALRDRYNAARRNPAAIRAIIAEFAADYGLSKGAPK